MQGITNAVLWYAWSASDGTHGERLLRGKQVESTFETGGYFGNDDTSLTLESLGPTIDEGDDRGGVDVSILVLGDQSHQERVDPSPGLDVVKSGDDHRELLIEAHVFVLNSAGVRGHQHAWDTQHDEIRSCRGLTLADISFTEQELAIEIRNVNGVHVDHMDVAEPGES